MDRALALKLQKWAIWAVLIAVVLLLRHLFPIFFLTFVLSYMGNSAVNALTRRFPRRKLNVILVWVVFLAIITGVTLLVVPRMLNEARNIARQFIATEAARQSDSGETFVDREARELVDSLIIGIAGLETFEDFRESDAYATIVTRMDAGLARTSARVTAGVTAFANQAIAFAFQFVLS